MTYTLAVKTDGTPWAWGDNSYGQLGDGTHTERGLPVQVGTDTTWASVATGFAGSPSYDSAGVKTDGTLWTWGTNYSSQLGLGPLAGQQSAPVQVSTGFSSVASGAYFMMVGARIRRATTRARRRPAS